MEELLLKSSPPAVEYPSGSNIYTCYFTGDTLLNQLKLPDIQRELDSEHIEYLYQRFHKEYEKYGYFNFGIFDLAYLDNTLYLLNGQHRYAVLNRLDKLHLSGLVQIKIKKTTSQSELNDYFRIVNHSKASVIYKNSNYQIILNSLRRHLNNKYSVYCVNSKKPHKPNINLDQLMEKIDEIKLVDRLKISDSETLINFVEELNEYYKSIQYKSDLWKLWKVPDVINLLEKTKLKSPMNTLYLGFYPQYEWLDRLLKHNTNNLPYFKMPHYCKNYKTRKISAARRMKVWRKRNTTVDSKCYVCNKGLNIENFQCGHIIAAFWGGSSDVSNLEPICASCNLDMGTENLEVYKSKEYP